jgi:hypothetical protein
MLKIAVSVLMLLILFGCTPKMNPVISGDITSVIVTIHYEKKKVAEITDAELINELIQKINESKREDISDVVWERGPDGTLQFKNEEDIVVLRYFSQHSPVDVIWTDNQRKYSLDTNIILEDLLN